MTDEQNVSSGELGRSLARIERVIEALAVDVRDRHHALANKVDAYIGPVAVLKEHMTDVRERLADHDTALTETKIQAGKITLAGTFLAIVAALIPWPWKMR